MIIGGLWNKVVNTENYVNKALYYCRQWKKKKIRNWLHTLLLEYEKRACNIDDVWKKKLILEVYIGWKIEQKQLGPFMYFNESVSELTWILYFLK